MLKPFFLFGTVASLSVRLRSDGATEPETSPLQALRRRQVSPMFWLHIPKCGTSFLNVVAHLPGNCDSLADRNIDEESFGKCFESTFNKMMPALCEPKHVHFPVSDLLGTALHGDFASMNHETVWDEVYNQQKGRFMSLFRQPEQRLLSQWYDEEDNFKAVPFISRCSKNRTPQRLMSMSEFQETYASQATKQLAGIVKSSSEVTQADVDKALERLREGFAFVGLEEEWDLSVCLFHVKFGGACRPSDFENTRPGPKSVETVHRYDESALNGWRDLWDAQIYEEARHMFWKDLEDFGVSHRSCERCYKEAEPL